VPLDQAGVKLHALVALGSVELARLKRLREMPVPPQFGGPLNKYKKDSSCRASKAITTDGDLPSPGDQPSAQPDADEATPTADGQKVG